MIMMQKIVILLDLDGVLATRDIAFDLFKSKGWGTKFEAASNEIADAVNAGKNFNGQKAYAGQTVEHVMRKAIEAGVQINEAEIKKIAEEARLMPGSKRLIRLLNSNPNVKDVFVISTTYKAGADVIAKRLGISPKKVFATELKTDTSRTVVGTRGPACGGIHKASTVKEISTRTGTPLGRMVAVGDSITDIGMMIKVIGKGGLGIAFNAHQDLILRKPNVIYAGRSLRPAYGLIKAFALEGHAGVKRIVERNIRMRRLIGVPMSLIGRPFLFRPGKKDKKTRAKSAKYRAKVRSKKIARLR